MFVTGCGELVKESKMEEANLEEVTNEFDFVGSGGGANGLILWVPMVVQMG